MKDERSPEHVGHEPDWDVVMVEYRERWTDRGRRTWDDVEPGYRIGYDIARSGRDRAWNDVEPEFKRRWTAEHPDKPWDRFLDAAQDIWDDLTAEPGPSPKAGSPLAHDESSGR